MFASPQETPLCYLLFVRRSDECLILPSLGIGSLGETELYTCDLLHIVLQVLFRSSNVEHRRV